MVSPMSPVPSLLSLLRTSSSELTSSQPTPDAAAAVASWGSVWVWGQRVACAQLCLHTPLSSPCWPGHSWRCCGNNQRCLSATTLCIPVLSSALLHLPLLSPLDTRQDGHRGQQCSLCQDHSLGTRDTQWGSAWCWGWMLTPFPCWAAHLQLCWTHWCQCWANLGPFPHWTRLSRVAAGATCAAVGAVLPARGAQAPLAMAVGLEQCMEWESTEQSCPHTVMSPRPLQAPVPRMPVALPVLRGTGKICNLALLSG